MAEGHDRESLVEDAIVEKWKREQIELKKKLVCKDCIIWGESTSNPFSNLSLIGGVDISFVKDDPDHACACLVVLSFPELEVLYEDLTLVHLKLPYIPEFLAFREVGFLVEAVSKLKNHEPLLLPQIILVDGNGMLHPRGFGIASHLGVLTDIPTVGVAKTLFNVDGIEKDSKHADQINNCLKSNGDSFPLVGDSGTIWGKALRSTQQSHNPIYISVGHKIGLETAVSLVHATCWFRIPEPIRQADKRSRKYLKQHYPKELETCSCRMQNDERNPQKEHDDPEKEGQDLVHDSCRNFDHLNIS